MKRILAGVLAMCLGGSAAWAADDEKDRIRQIVKEVLREYAATLGDRQATPAAKEVMRNLVQDNRNFVRSHGPAYFSHFVDGQHPRATVVSCSDSRVHMHALDGSPDGDLFVIRNIGNQIATAEGSVEYGVHHLHTPVLLIVGHSACGAIKAAASDYSGESGPIRHELDTIQIPKGEAGMSSVRLNVNNQVKQAMAKFEEDVLAGKLTVVGAVYDFRNELKKGQGKLTVININGETDAGRIAALDLMKYAETPAPAGKKAKPAAAGHH
ncbi:MAG: carbonic anhydrase [Pseudomonadota bacterium]